MTRGVDTRSFAVHRGSSATRMTKESCAILVTGWLGTQPRLLPQ